MVDPRLTRMAQTIIRYSTRVKPGDRVRISGETPAIPLMEQLYIEALKAGAHPYVDVAIPSLGRYFYQLATKEQLSYVSPLGRVFIDHFDVNIAIMSETNPHHMSAIDPKKQSLRHKANRKLIDRQLRRMNDGSFRACITIYPTEAYASGAEMSLEDFENFVFSACYVDHPNPLKRWEQVQRHHDRVIEHLQSRSTIRIVAPGTDITFSIKGRGWMNCDGHVNFPDGEIYTCPIENSAEGTIEFTYPACLYGREVEQVRLTFERGRVVSSTAKKNEEFLHEMLATDPGATRLGEFAIGTNSGIDRYSKNILFDEKIAGTCHLALGASAPGCGGRNKSSIHWDMVCDLRHGTIFADGKPFYRKGDFILKKLRDPHRLKKK